MKSTGDLAVDYAIGQSKAIQKCMQLDAEMAYRSLPKQETLHEVALEFAKDHYEMYETSNLGSMHFGFIEGAKWQQEQMYSEEEVYNLLEEAMKDCYASELEHHHSGDYKNLKEWFEQVKNK